MLIGFALGLQHATETDHIVAVTALVSDSRTGRRSALTGALWGFGHLLTLFLVGTALILLHLKMGARTQWALDFVVALVLIWLGVHTIRKCFTGRYHFHAHSHGGLTHAHLHFHSHAEPAHAHDSHALKAAQPFLEHSPASVFIGMAHGLAGTGALALVVLTSIPSRLLGLTYLFLFGLGALVGMAVFSALLGFPLARAAKRLTWLNALRIAAGTLSAGLGAVLSYRAFLPGSFPF